mmetsp:Transcript_7360/g.11589  ORF Transcript_7360/g.11589 Transcript_7360/m.11589 type:complete len:241 (+) Transcript_7360:591-1313(+)|eukprot:CAMPEP_0184306094 /NCGR_PEP_ID=MMETSP1049-20130417/15188_1 /TAXON_ID=77928 /ORGANISM="Proteomonas sulcata, Strain CCMP704" /LENGTH=240 /DNA_ID=CAMNT_0026618283 /DNA_START=580 /DNA_END=1302 /DNA_ORIENTATION=+
MAHGLGSGWVEVEGVKTTFSEVPCYHEKNWGGGFPSKWAWIQCNSFRQLSPEVAHPDSESVTLTLTSTIGRRGLLALPGVEEEVGMLAMHSPKIRVPATDPYGNKMTDFTYFFELSWRISPWGFWELTGANEDYSFKLTATCEDKGTVIRAPAPLKGMVPLCRETFQGQMQVELVELKPGGDSFVFTSNGAALEVGGGPWYEDWVGEAFPAEPLKTVGQLPVDIDAFQRLLPPLLRIPGL